MLKNSKLLKGMSLAFALVLLLSCGILLSGTVDAGEKNVVFFVSDHGDNTTGADAATAFTSIDTAIKKANAMKLDPGTELTLIIVDRVTVTTQKVDGTIAVDSEGNRMPVTITSLNSASEDDFSKIILAYHNTSGTSNTRHASFYNDITFLNVDIKIRVFETRVGNNPTGKRFHASNIHFMGFETTFDHCLLGPEEKVADMDYIYTYFDYGGNNANVYMDKVVNFKNNSKFDSVLVVHYYRVPNIGLTVNFENVELGTVHVNRMSNTETIDDLKYLNINVGNGTVIGNLYLVSANGNHGFTEGMTINYYPGCTINGLVAGTSNNKGILKGGITHNVYGGTFNGAFASGTNGPVHGDITNNIYGGTFNSSFAGGGGNNEKALTNVTGTITNNIYGGTFNGAFYGAGCLVTEKSGYSANYQKVINNVTGGTFAGTFIGGSDGPGSIASIENNITGVDFPGVMYGASVAGCDVGDVVTNLHDVSIGAEFYAGTQKNSSIVNLTNNITGNCVFGARAYFGSFGNGNTEGDVTGRLENNIYSGTFKSTVYLSSRTATVTGKVVSNIYGGDFTASVFGGMRNPSATAGCYVADITNNIYGGKFATNFAGGNSDTGDVKGSIVNNVYGGTFGMRFIGGNYASSVGDVIGTVTNNIQGGTFLSSFVAGCGDNGTVKGSVNTVISGGTFQGAINGQNDNANSVDGAVELTIGATSEESVLMILGSLKNAKAKLVASEKAILIGKDTNLEFSSVSGTLPVLFSQTEAWVEDQVYATFSPAISADAVKAVNGASSVVGSATFDGTELKGSAVAATDSAPSLSGLVSFHLNENLGVRFWIDKDSVTDYITKNGSWNYVVLFDGKEIANVSFTSVDQLPAADIRSAGGVDYFTFLAGLDIPSTAFGKDITIVLNGLNTTTYTVYELLENGVESTTMAGQTELATLLKSIHNYGVEAYNVFEGTSNAILYDDVSYTGNYTAATEFTKSRGYSFYGTSLSLNGQVEMNFYVNALTDVQFKAVIAGTTTELDSSKIVVKKVSGNDNYNYIVTIKLTVPEMNNVYTLIVTDGTYDLATCTTSVTSACAAYIDGGYIFSDVSAALLAYVEASQAYLTTI